jgi:hypothetical protein
VRLLCKQVQSGLACKHNSNKVHTGLLIEMPLQDLRGSESDANVSKPLRCSKSSQDPIANSMILACVLMEKRLRRRRMQTSRMEVIDYGLMASGC